MILASFFYEVFLGTVLLVTAKSIGSTSMYLFLKSYFKSEIKNYLKKKKIISNNIYKKINNRKIFFFIFIRMIPAIPYQITDLLPIVFNMNVKSYFFTKFIGSFLSNLIIINMLANFYKKINLKFDDSLIDINASLIISIFLFIILIVLGFYYKKKFFKIN